ncbi:MAG TPA: hypothetical protein VMV59_10775 [Candidatus Dormibacteraeota bacterium]|nr:hypothetical protein [Candidatus Dormibacteraeota bacterium]
MMEPLRATARLSASAANRYRRLSWLLARRGVRETAETRVLFESSVQAIWDALMFYEEVPGGAPLLLRALLPQPVRTEGDKRRPGARVRCVYSGGAELVKRITDVEPPHLLRFDVVEQRLGVEDCILTRGGSYEIRACGDLSEVVLTTNYEAYLRPRRLWCHLEAAVVSQLHRHILHGVGAEIPAGNRAMRPTVAEKRVQCGPAGGLACTISPSCFRRWW